MVQDFSDSCLPLRMFGIWCCLVDIPSHLLHGNSLCLAAGLLTPVTPIAETSQTQLLITLTLGTVLSLWLQVYLSALNVKRVKNNLFHQILNRIYLQF